jgi:hypothetical protein
VEAVLSHETITPEDPDFTMVLLLKLGSLLMRVTMKRMLLLFLALACLVSAQNMTGLPGVIQITGSAQSVTANNLTSKDIVCVVVRSVGGSPVISIIWLFRFPIKAGGAPYNLRGAPEARGASSQNAPTSTYVDLVVFADGSYTGPDSGGSLPSVTAGAAAFVAAGQLVVNAPNQATAYGQLQAQTAFQPSPTAKRVEMDEAFAIHSAAGELLRTKNGSGDAAAEALAARFMALGTLHPAASN